MTVSVLATAAWWRLLLERLGRQAAQTAVPLLVAITMAGGRIDSVATVYAIGGALVVTLVKAALLFFVDITPTPDAALAWRLADRAVPAFAGVLVGLWPADAASLITFDLRGALVAAAAAAVTAVLAVYVTPPALTPAPQTPDGAHVITTAPAGTATSSSLEQNGSLE